MIEAMGILVVDFVISFCYGSFFATDLFLQNLRATLCFYCFLPIYVHLRVSAAKFFPLLTTPVLFQIQIDGH